MTTLYIKKKMVIIFLNITFYLPSVTAWLRPVRFGRCASADMVLRITSISWLVSGRECPLRRTRSTTRWVPTTSHCCTCTTTVSNDRGMTGESTCIHKTKQKQLGSSRRSKHRQGRKLKPKLIPWALGSFAIKCYCDCQTALVSSHVFYNNKRRYRLYTESRQIKSNRNPLINDKRFEHLYDSHKIPTL